MSFGRFKDDSSSGKGQPTGASTSDNSSGSFLSGSNDKKEAYIGKGSKIVGTLHFSGPTELDGEVEGEVVAHDRLVVGESATINAKLSGTEVIIKGVVNGDIFATKRLLLKKSARVVGSLTSPLLSIEEGVIFEGKIAMVAAEKKSIEASAAAVKQSAAVPSGSVNASGQRN